MCSFFLVMKYRLLYKTTPIYETYIQYDVNLFSKKDLVIKRLPPNALFIFVNKHFAQIYSRHAYLLG